MKYFLFVTTFVLYFSAHCQNLVPNPGFEETISCDYPLVYIEPGDYPFSIDSSETLTISLTHWFTSGSADYFNSCNSTFPNIYKFLPRAGNGYVGIISLTRFDDMTFPNYKGTREFIETKLSQPLKSGCTYNVSFHVRLNPTPHVGVSGVMGIDGIGMYISQNRMSRTNWDSHEPQIKNPEGNILNDTSEYVEISGTYTATGNERYIAIGNFKTDINTHAQVVLPSKEWEITGSYYLVDDVSFMPVSSTQHPLNLGKDTILCNNNGFPLTLTAPPNFNNYNWSTSESTPSIQINAPGKYWLTANFDCGFESDTIVVSLLSETPKINLGQDTTLCMENFTLNLAAPLGYDHYNWSNGGNKESIIVSHAGKYTIQAYNECFTSADTIIVSIYSPHQHLIFPISDTTICEGNSITLNTLKGFQKYQWNNNAIIDSLVVDSAGSYILNVTAHEGCKESDTINIYTMTKPTTFYGGIDTTFCDYGNIQLLLPYSNPDIQYKWNITQGSSLFASASGTYYLKIVNKCFTISDSINIQFINCNLSFPNLITINNDDMNESFKIINPLGKVLKLEVFNSWGQRIFYSDDYQNDWPKKAISSGIYYYSISDLSEQREFKGWIQVIKE